MSAVDAADVYSRLDTLVRRARDRSNGGIGKRVANSITGQWLNKPASRLVEAVLVSGRLILDSFDEGLELLVLAEEQGEYLSGAAYSSLMRLGLVEMRYADVLSLLSRASEHERVCPSGAVLAAMKAADALGDWGAVSRLFSLLSLTTDDADEGAQAQEAALQQEALELELVLVNMQTRVELPGGKSIKPPASAPNLAEAYSLALRAHCQRGDVPRAVGIVEALRDRGRPLPRDTYSQLISLSRRSGSLTPVQSINPADVFHTLVSEMEPVGMTITNRVRLQIAALGTVERAVVAGVVGCSVVAALVAAISNIGLGQPVSPLEASWDLLDSSPPPGLY